MPNHMRTALIEQPSLILSLLVTAVPGAWAQDSARLVSPPTNAQQDTTPTPDAIEAWFRTELPQLHEQYVFRITSLPSGKQREPRMRGLKPERDDEATGVPGLVTAAGDDRIIRAQLDGCTLVIERRFGLEASSPHAFRGVLNSVPLANVDTSVVLVTRQPPESNSFLLLGAPPWLIALRARSGDFETVWLFADHTRWAVRSPWMYLPVPDRGTAEAVATHLRLAAEFCQSPAKERSAPRG